MWVKNDHGVKKMHLPNIKGKELYFVTKQLLKKINAKL
jgi:hypothetical protein